jgi:hypothetical protein
MAAYWLKNCFSVLLLRNLNMSFNLTSMKLLINYANPFVTLSTGPPAGFRTPPMSLEPVFTVMKIVSVSSL